MLHLGGSISDVARAVFTRVRVGWYGVLDDDEKRGELTLPWGDDAASVLTKWINVAGESLTSLSFGSSIQQPNPETCREMLIALREKCSALHRLNIREILRRSLAGAMLASTQGRLYEVIADSSHALKIAKYCAGLRDLILWGIMKICETCFVLSVRR